MPIKDGLALIINSSSTRYCHLPFTRKPTPKNCGNLIRTKILIKYQRPNETWLSSEINLLHTCTLVTSITKSLIEKIVNL